MSAEKTQALIALIKDDMRPALGVTESAAIALAVAMARKAVGGEELRSIELSLDPGVFKNGFSCRIPGTGEQGNPLAALLGAVAGDPDKGMRVLEDVAEEDVIKAKALEREGRVTVNIVDGMLDIYIEAIVVTERGTARVLTERRHDNITLVEVNGGVVSRKIEGESSGGRDAGKGIETYSLHDFYSFATSVSEEDIAFVLEAVKLNAGLVEAGRPGAGLGVGAAMAAMEKDGRLAHDAISAAQITLAMAIDARMGGESKSAMTICGSGDHGIICTMPLAALAEDGGMSQGSLARAISMSYLVTMHIKHFAGRLSAFCGCAVAAGTGMAAGAALLMGGDEKAVAGTIDNMAANLTGMICDGGNLGCTLKAVAAAGTGVLSARLALAGIIMPPHSGIVGANVEETMRNIGKIANPGMLAVNDAILGIMRPGKA